MAEENPFAAALRWLQSVLLGSLATSVSVLAVAALGVLLLSGRMDLRRGAQVVLGCFVLFGASTIASGIMSALQSSGVETQVSPASEPQAPFSAPTAEASPTSAPYDPYAGAAPPPK